MSTCPICGRDNHCKALTDPENCWCNQLIIPKSLLNKIPSGKKGSCVCEACVREHNKLQSVVDFLVLIIGLAVGTPQVFENIPGPLLEDQVKQVLNTVYKMFDDEFKSIFKEAVHHYINHSEQPAVRDVLRKVVIQLGWTPTTSSE